MVSNKLCNWLVNFHFNLENNSKLMNQQGTSEKCRNSYSFQMSLIFPFRNRSSNPWFRVERGARWVLFSDVTASISDGVRGRAFARERCASGTCALTISPVITKQPRDACPGAMSIDQLSVSDAIYAIASCAPWVGRLLLLQVASEGRHVRFAAAAAAVLPSPICIARSSTRPGTTRYVRSHPEPEKTSRRLLLGDPRLRPRLQETRFSLPPIVARRTRGDATAIAECRRRVRGDNDSRWEG